MFTRPLGNRSVVTVTRAVDGFKLTGEGPDSVINGVGRAARGAVTGGDTGELGETYREDRHGVAIYGAQDVTVDNLTISNQGGDGVLVLGNNVDVEPARDISITRLRAVGNRRQGISATNFDGLLIADSIMERTGSAEGPGEGSPTTNPSAGIDIEPDRATDEIQNLVIRDTIIRDNLGDGLTFFIGPLNDASAPVSARVSDLWIDGNGQNGITVSQVGNGSPSERVDGRIRFENLMISDSRGVLNDCCKPGDGTRGSGGILILQNPGASAADPYATDPDDLRLTFHGVTVRGTGTGGDTVGPIALRSYGAAAGTNETRPESMGLIDFWNVSVIDDADRPILKAQLNDTSTFLSNLTGEVHAFNPNGVSVDYDLDRLPDPTGTVAVRDARAFADGDVLTDAWVTDGAQARDGTLTIKPGGTLPQALPGLVGPERSTNYVFAGEVEVLGDGEAAYDIGLRQTLPGGGGYGRVLSARGEGTVAKGWRVPAAPETVITDAAFVIENTGDVTIKVTGLSLAPAEGPVIGLPPTQASRGD